MCYSQHSWVCRHFPDKLRKNLSTKAVHNKQPNATHTRIQTQHIHNSLTYTKMSLHFWFPMAFKFNRIHTRKDVSERNATRKQMTHNKQCKHTNEMIVNKPNAQHCNLYTETHIQQFTPAQNQSMFEYFQRFQLSEEILLLTHKATMKYIEKVLPSQMHRPNEMEWIGKIMAQDVCHKVKELYDSI